MKLGKKCMSLILALVMIFGLTINASAAETETVTVQLSPNINVKLDGEIQTMTDVNGNPVYPVLYGGTTYLPIRAVGNMLGLDVGWDGAAQTVILEKSDSKTNPAKSDGKNLTQTQNPTSCCFWTKGKSSATISTIRSLLAVGWRSRSMPTVPGTCLLLEISSVRMNGRMT